MTTTHIGGLVLLRTGHFGLELGYLGLNIRHGDTLPNNIQNDCVAEMRMARQQRLIIIISQTRGMFVVQKIVVVPLLSSCDLDVCGGCGCENE